MHAFDRTERLIGRAALEALNQSRIAVIGIGGVGSFAAEALVRSGIGAITLVDSDCIDETNINRQIHAMQNTVGEPKVDVMRKRLLSVNPTCRIEALQMRYTPQAEGMIDLKQFDYVLDCIDSVSDKEALIVDCIRTQVPVISCMGAGNRMDPTAFRVMDIYDTSVDPLARVMRSRLRKRGVKALKVVCSLETPRETSTSGVHRRVAASIVFATSVAGMVMASEAVLDIALRGK
ncbi:MAG: tRNA threonylcarbamoyladenosine dehydratase [Bacillota bacterium]